MPTKVFSAVALAIPLAASACAQTGRVPPVRPAADSLEGQNPRFFPPPFALADPDDAVVRVVGPQRTCSGTLVDEDLVLTAHHCLARVGPRGEPTSELVAPKELRIELGGDYLAWGYVAVSGIVTPTCANDGGRDDVAILILPRKLVGLGTLPPRLETPPHVGEELDPVGFGRCALSGDGIRRQARDGGPVVAVTNETASLKASICPGDSGGPVLARGGREVVGIISLSAMDGDEHTRAPTVVTRVDAFRPVFAHARLIADGTPQNELPPLGCR